MKSSKEKELIYHKKIDSSKNCLNGLLKVVFYCAEDVISFINRAEDRLEVPLAIAKYFLEDMVCECESGLQTNAELP